MKEGSMTSLGVHIVGSVHARLGEHEKTALSEACSLHNVPISEHTVLSEITQTLLKNPNDLLFVDTPALAELVECHNFIANKNTILILFERENPALETHLSKIQNLRYILSAYHPKLFKAACETIFSFHKKSDDFSMRRTLLCKNSIKEHQFILKSSTERSSAQDSTLSFFAECILQHKDNLSPGISSYPKYMSDVLDELLMNAIWDANHNRMHIDRTQSVSLDANETISIDAAFDGHNLALTVQDSHGSFPQTAVRKPVKYALGFRDETEVQETSRGAGLGLYMVLQKVIAMSFEVTPEKTTRVTALLMGDQSLREMQKRPRTLLFLFSE
jgi:hypothetical protein